MYVHVYKSPYTCVYISHHIHVYMNSLEKNITSSPVNLITTPINALFYNSNKFILKHLSYVSNGIFGQLTNLSIKFKSHSDN